ncbi:complement decay-accelerating factor [Amblyraja radiata]|uniref:complement decay-accelerating factor n=1 Tax=Amblyraja radiata TaxID=386614 RepID=UPI00140211EE|nr:complement decay-accelerating factor [Amblyraja radiata]
MDKGSSASYRCHPGYNLIGRPTRNCSERGWQGELPECRPKSCGSPGDILNGWANVSSNVFGGKVTFHCNTGYLMVGRALRLCEAQGWSGQVPNCNAVKCVAPPAIDSGSVSDLFEGDFWEYGMVAAYSCHSPYTLIGEKEIACSASGNWSHPPPMCKGNENPLQPSSPPAHLICHPFLLSTDAA